jgi:hypothetical protein
MIITLCRLAIYSLRFRPVTSRPKFAERSIEALRSLSLTSTDILLNDTEEIEVTLCYIRGIW